MTAAPTLMRAEIHEIPDAVSRLLDGEGERIRDIGARLRKLDPAVVASVARGSSDHAATYFKYATEIVLGRPVASLGPSIASVYGARLRLEGQLAVAISQSGRSPDIVALQAACRAGGAQTLALVNVEDSPLLREASMALPLRAGPERSVAATKSFVAAVAAALAVLAAWSEDETLARAVRQLPQDLRAALDSDWSPALDTIVAARSLYALGRGPGFAVAGEAALKFKETAMLHAESFSGAEVVHGPVSLVEPGFPVLAFVPDDAARPGLRAICERVASSGAALFVAGEAGGAGTRLPTHATGHPLTEPLSMLVSFYGFAEHVSRARGHDPDRPRGLLKVTETV